MANLPLCGEEAKPSQRRQLFALHSIHRWIFNGLSNAMFGNPNMLQRRTSGNPYGLARLGRQTEPSHLLPQRGAGDPENPGGFDDVTPGFLQRHFDLPPLGFITCF